MSDEKAKASAKKPSKPKKPVKKPGDNNKGGGRTSDG